MITIQMTLDETLVNAVDKMVKKLHTTRSAFTRTALRESLQKFQAKQLEKKHREGYAQHPVSPQEFSIWENEQSWGDS